MPRGNRYYLSGDVWHITHRCHKREFLLKFARDRRRWLQWLGEAKKRFGVIIRDDKGEEVIPQTMQLIAGRTGQEYNQRKNRKGRNPLLTRLTLELILFWFCLIIMSLSYGEVRGMGRG